MNRRILAAGLPAVACLVVLAALVLSSCRSAADLPGADATPQQVVTAYLRLRHAGDAQSAGKLVWPGIPPLADFDGAESARPEEVSVSGDKRLRRADVYPEFVGFDDRVKSVLTQRDVEFVEVGAGTPSQVPGKGIVFIALARSPGSAWRIIRVGAVPVLPRDSVSASQ